MLITDKNITTFGCSRTLKMIRRKDHILVRSSMSLVERSLVSEVIIARGQEIHCPKYWKLKLFPYRLTKSGHCNNRALKAWQKIGVTFDSHQIWTVEWSHHCPITGRFSALFVISPPRESFVKSQISMRKSCEKEWWLVPVGEIFICQNLGPNLSEIEVRTFVSIKKVILDQLLASKVEII